MVDILTALVMSVTANSTAEIQSLLALGPVVGNIAPIVTVIGGVFGLLSPPQPPKAAGISNDNAAPSMVTFCETLVVQGWVLWVMPAKIGFSTDLLERNLTTVRQNLAESVRASQVAGAFFARRRCVFKREGLGTL